jgi:type 1 glutamine amidotransferase
MHLRHATALTLLLLVISPFQTPGASQAPGGAQQPAPAGRGERGRGGGDPFAGQPRINALVVSGGCCHDYPLQTRLMVDALNRSLPIDWTIAVQGGRGTRGSMPVYARPDWADGFDIVVHNECLANVDDPAYIRRITAAHRDGPPAMVIHCAMHSYRAATVDDWREFLGVTSRTHTKMFPIPVKVTAREHPVMKGFKEDWVTPSDELYVIEKVWPNTTALASAVSPEDKKEYPLAWAGEYQGARVFGTTLGHGDATWEDPVFQDLLARGFKWLLNRQ